MSKSTVSAVAQTDPWTHYCGECIPFYYVNNCNKCDLMMTMPAVLVLNLSHFWPLGVLY
ncbi:Uncharacterized protein APZ42_009581 [Daphnia magna]|uniref:Uncharacterized protein n=1 Tax=Daphnia magna TaxID=35525 RepID=A0A164DXM6_9CRUS|nr:Uncharacterized protein APZ42_009581 [Daphnia magna]